MTTSPATGSIRRVLSHDNFRFFIIGDGISLVGNWVQRVAIGWLTWELTHSGAWLGIIAFCDLFPSLIFSPLGGAIADRFDRLRVAIISQAAAMLQAIALVFFTGLGLIDIWGLVALTVLRGAIASINQPVRLAMLPSLVPREDLSAAIALNSVLFNTARSIGPAVAGVAIVQGGVVAAFTVNTLSFLALLYALMRIRIPRAMGDGKERANIFRQAWAGYHYVVGHPGIGPILFLLMLAAMFARPVSELLPGFAAGIFSQGADGLAWMTSVMGVGAMAGGMWFLRYGTHLRRTALAAHALAIMGGALVVFTSLSNFWLTLPFLALISFSTTVNNISIQSLVQNAVDGAMRGRVMSIYGMIFRGGPAIGALVMGGLSESFGLRLPIAAGGVVCLAAWLWAAKRQHALAQSLK
ncbi:MAG: MFS transporter [Alphaproteobacteria bacterium]